MQQALETVKKKAKHLKQETEGKMEEIYISTGWKDLNVTLGGGLRKKSLVAFGGSPGIGKTAFMLSMASMT